MPDRKLAIVTGASSGIGLEIARLAAADGYDLLIAADEPLVDAASAFQQHNVEVTSIEADLATQDGVRRLIDAAGSRPIDILVANAGQGHGGAFLDQPAEQWRHVIDTNVTGTLLLIQTVAKQMVERGSGRVLITGSIAGHVPGTFNAIYNGTKAFIDNFAAALAEEMDGSGVTVTCLKPGATDTDFFARAGMEDTRVGQAKKDDPADVAATGWEAMLEGERVVVHGLKNKAQVVGSGLISEEASAKMHRKLAEPGGGTD